MERGHVFRLRPSPGAEETNKPRPVVIVSRDTLNRGAVVLCVPFYSQQLESRKAHRSTVFFQAGEAGLDKDCVAKCDELALIDKTRLQPQPIGRVNAAKMAAIVRAIRYVIRDDDLPNSG